MSAAESRIWLITGCSSGLGLALAEAAIASGDRVATTARTIESLPASLRKHSPLAFPVQLDVDCEISVAGAVDRVVSHFGRIDVLVNNAGYCYLSAIEEGEMDEIKRQFETNFFGTVRVTNQVLPHMRKAGCGLVVNVSSVAGIYGLGGMGYYCASKFAVEGFSEALSDELSCFDISVTLVEPSGMWSNFTKRSIVTARRHIEDYTTSAIRKRRILNATEGELGDVRKAAAIILDDVQSGRKSKRLILGAAADLVYEKAESLHAAYTLAKGI